MRLYDFIRIEEYLNGKNLREACFFKQTNAYDDDIDMDAVKQVLGSRKPAYNEHFYDHLEDKLRKAGYVKKSGMTDFAKFYTEAFIGGSVWNGSIKLGQPRPEIEPLLRIVIALKMPEEEARPFLNMAGNGFHCDGLRDNLILSCMELGYWEPEDIYEILEFFRYDKKTGMALFKNIYQKSMFE